jgi:transcriptional regulator with XRE-family HTH domain
LKALKKEFGRRLAKLRKDRGFKTQEALAKALGMDQPTVGRWESGRINPGPENLKHLCEVLGIDESVFSATEEPNADTIFSYVRRLETELDATQNNPLWRAFEKATASQKKVAMRALTSDPDALLEFEAWLSQREKAE